MAGCELSIVIPTLNGALRLQSVVPRVVVAATSITSPDKFEILIVNDGSNTTEAAVLQSLEIEYSCLSVITLGAPAVPTGQIHATLTGVAAASGRIIVTMDDDGGHPPEVIPQMIEVMRENTGTSLVYASPVYASPRRGRGNRTAGNIRSTDPGPARPRKQHWIKRRWIRQIGTRLNNFVFHAFLGLPRDIPVGSFRAIRRDLVEKALAKPVRYPYLSAMLLQFYPCVDLVRYKATYPAVSGSAEATRYSTRRLAGIWMRVLLYWGPLRRLGAFLRPSAPFVTEETAS
jgi:glycosyltransferase involved in cell wall biosynthesis